MKRRILGRTGISVSELGLGTMMFGSSGNSDHDEAVRMIHTALDAGINLVDNYLAAPPALEDKRLRRR